MTLTNAQLLVKLVDEILDFKLTTKKIHVPYDPQIGSPAAYDYIQVTAEGNGHKYILKNFSAFDDYLGLSLLEAYIELRAAGKAGEMIKSAKMILEESK